MRADRRGVSIAITHALTIAITAILLSTLLVGTGQLLDNQETRVAQQQFSEIGSDVTSQIDRLDRLSATGEEVNATVRPTYPDRVVGSQYTINVTDDDDRFPFDTEYALEVRSDALDRPIQYPLETDAALNASAEARGGEVAICLVDGEITLGGGCP